MDQQQKADVFSRMHTGEQAFILPNAWDVVSARLLEQAGFRAIATASAAIAWAAGMPDGELISRDQMISRVGAIARAVDVPVSADMERGFGLVPGDIAGTIELVIEAGLVGANLEDGDGRGSVIARRDMVANLRAVRAMVDVHCPSFMINARVDNLYRSGETPQNLRETIDRANAYLDAGATSIFVLTHGADMIGQLATSIRGPLNILAIGAELSLADYQKMGVKRVTLGPSLLSAALYGVQQNAKEMQEHGTFGFLRDSLPFAGVQELLGGR